MIGIYKITSPSGKIYIGSSIHIEKRLKNYKLSTSKGQIRLYNSFRKYGLELHTMEIVEQCTLEELLTKETYYGILYNVLGNNGLNCKLPRKGEIKYTVSEDTKRRMSIAHSGERNPCYRKIYTDENRANMSRGQLGRKQSEEHRIKSAANSLLRQTKIVLDYNTGIFYSSAREVAFLLKVNYNTLRQRLNGSLKNNTGLQYV